MQTIENKILSRLKKCGRGKVFFAADFANVGTPETVKKSLQRLQKSGVIKRAAHGIYYYPKKDYEFYGEMVSPKPSIDEIARAIAHRDKARIVPIGDYALNLLNLSTQVPVNVVYITTGASRRVKIDGSWHGILFKHSSEQKRFAYKSELLMLIVSAMREIGEGKIYPEELEIIKEKLKYATQKDIDRDIDLMPIWVREIVLKLWNS